MARKKHYKSGVRTIEQVTKDFLTQAKSKIKESTFSRYNFICERHLIPYFEDMDLDKLNDESIIKFMQHKLNIGGLTGKPLSPKTINDMICLLLQIVKRYCKLDIDVEKLSCKQSEIGVFTETEYNCLKAHLSIGTDNKKLGIIVAMLTGIRIGELCALKWENIDLDGSIIVINKTMQRIKTNAESGSAKTKIIIDTPKSNASVRTIPIPEILRQKLKCFKSQDNTYLLTNTTDYIEPRIYQRHFKKYLSACNIKDNNFHALRHTFATRAISREVDIKTVSLLLGHTDVSFTMKRYVHPNMEHKRIQIEKLAIGF